MRTITGNSSIPKTSPTNRFPFYTNATEASEILNT